VSTCGAACASVKADTPNSNVVAAIAAYNLLIRPLREIQFEIELEGATRPTLRYVFLLGNGHTYRAFSRLIYATYLE